MFDTRFNFISSTLATLLLILLAGCSDSTSPTAQNSPAEFRYPELTDVMIAAGPVPGFAFVNMLEFALDDPIPCDSAEDAEWIRAGYHEIVDIYGTMLVDFNPYCVSDDMEITVVAPHACYAVIDCYPHPFQFQDTVEITFDFSELNYPEDYDFSELVPWYLTDSGEYVEVAYEWSDSDDLTLFTDHFSRYIIARRLSP